MILALALGFVISGIISAQAQLTEDEIVQSYIKKTKNKQTRKVGWLSGNFTWNMLNSSDYKKFAEYSSHHITNGSIDNIKNGNVFGLNFGVMFKSRLAFVMGGEYWLKMGTSETGAFTYNPPTAAASTINDLKSEIKVWGISGGVDYYLKNPPEKVSHLQNLSLKVGARIGYYEAKWDLWNSFENLNLATAAPSDRNTTFQGSAPGFSAHLGAQYPTGLWDFALGMDISYLYLNFTNVAWYNSVDDEIVVSYDGTQDGRVDLDFSGMQLKFELTRFFSW